MIQTPKSMTAVVHVRFHYKETEAEPASEGEVEIMNRVLDKISELSPDLQEILVKFVDYLNGIGDGRGQRPS